MAVGEDKQPQDHSNLITTEQPEFTNSGESKQEEVKPMEQMEPDWEHVSELMYLGHGEWGFPEDGMSEDRGETKDTIQWDPEWVRNWRMSVDRDVALHHQVRQGGYPNRWGARIPIAKKWNIELLQELLKDYGDKEIVEWLKYGWPTGRLPTLPDPVISVKNHKGVTDHPQALAHYIDKEIRHGAVMGPYNKIPFRDKVGISALSTRPKKNSEERRIILDLSFPVGRAVNDGILKDDYMGLPARLRFPRVDDFACRIFTLGQGCLMFKVDLSRYFRQLPLDLGDYSLIGYIINGEIYFDKVLPMGMRSAPYIVQRVTNAIAYIHRKLEYFLLNYVDDFVAAEVKETVWQAYTALMNLLSRLGADTAADKLVPPTTRLEFLGVTFDSITMTMEISEEKMTEIKQELNGWLYKATARRKEVESLIGKLQFMAKCIKAGRIFLSRLIQWIRGMKRNTDYTVPLEARRDITWWARCAEQFNGVSLLWLHKDPDTDVVLATDACLTGYGGTMGNQYFRARFPENVKGKNIAYLEILAVMVALKLWGQALKGKYFWIHVDNEAVASVFNTGASKEMNLQEALREIALLAAKYQFVIKARHIMGVNNRVPDWLSRWAEPEARKEFRKYATEWSLKQVKYQPPL